MPDLLHYDSGAGYTTETESSAIPAIIVGSMGGTPDPAGVAALFRRALTVLAMLPYELRWTGSVDRGGLTYSSEKNTRVRLATISSTGGNRTLTATAVVVGPAWTAPAAGRRSDTPPPTPADLSVGDVDVWYGPRSEASTTWRPRRHVEIPTGGLITSASPGDIILTTRRGEWEFAIVVT